MRRWIIGLVAFALVIGAIFLYEGAMDRLPFNPKQMLESPNPDWEGILTVGVVSTWGSENFVSWLSARAREFEKANPGTLISILEFNEQAYENYKAKGQLPDVVILSAFVENDPQEVLRPVSGHLPLREDALASGEYGGRQYGVPVALGAYALMGNVPKLDALQLHTQSSIAEIAEGVKKSGRGIGCPVYKGVRAEKALEWMVGKGEIPVQYAIRDKAWPDFALDEKTLFFVATQREVRRMKVLQSAGRCFEIAMMNPGQAYSDQMLMLTIPKVKYTGHSADRGFRTTQAAKLAAYLICEESQEKLAQAGVFSTRQGLKLYDEGPMSDLENELFKDVQMPNAFETLD